MATKSASSGGKTAAVGSIKLKKNPAPPDKSPGVTFDKSWITARLEGDEFKLTVAGQASFAGRSSVKTQTVTLKDEPGLKPLADALSSLLDAYAEELETDTLESAYVARSFARQNGEEI